MHPDIIKFWEKLGKMGANPDILEITETVSRLYWFVYYPEFSEYKYEYVAWKQSDEETISYYFLGSSYNEAEMLRLIKLKAFL
jgi:hypothetical protein